MQNLSTKRSIYALGAVLFLCVVLHAATGMAAAQKSARKDCLDCHTKFSDKYLGMKNVHAVVKQKNCEGCHLRHGLVAKLILKQTGNELCQTCHTKDRMGMKPIMHTALKGGKCTDCHNPHASQTDHLLKVEGKDLCYQCHKKEDYEKKTVHAVLNTKGCAACHFSHSADEKGLLLKPETTLCLSCHDSGNSGFRKAHGIAAVVAGQRQFRVQKGSRHLFRTDEILHNLS
jgi:predicted CXXCH cytochrome family protein